MSVILDALRRARQGAPPQPRAADAPVSPPTLPAGLRVRGRSPVRRTARGGTRWSLLAVIAVLGGLVWAGIQFVPGYFAPLTQPRSVAGPRAAATDAAPPAASPQTAVAGGLPAAGSKPPSLTEPVDTVTQPPAVAPGTTPRAARRATTAPPRPAATPTEDVGPPRAVPPVPARPVPALTMPAVTATPAAPSVDHFQLAVRYQSLGNFEQALKHYNALLDEDEFHVEARNNLGLLYHQRGLAIEAVEQFRRAILINPQYTKARGNLAVALTSAGRTAEARAELKAALGLEPRNVDLLVNMALVDKAEGQPEVARETLIRAVGYQPAHPAANYNLALLYEEVGMLAKAYDHYNVFLTNAGPEYGSRLTDVRRKVELLAPKLSLPTRR